MTTPLEVRSKLVDALRLDLVGPTGALGKPKESLLQSPSRWYLTGYLVPTEADVWQNAGGDYAQMVSLAGSPN